MSSRAAFLAAVPAALAASALPVRAQEAPLRVGSVPTDGFAEAYYAQDMGFFEKAGLKVEITTFNNGQGSVTGVAANAIDVGITSVNAVTNAVLHGIPMAYIGAGNLFNAAAPTLHLCTAKDTPLKTAKDFEGQTIAVAGLKDGTNVCAAAYLTKNGADLAKVKFIELPFPQMAPALKRGTIAGATIAEPFLTAGADDLKPFGNAFAILGDRYMLGGWIASRPWVEKNRGAAAKFMSAIYETARWANTNHEKSGAILLKYAKIDPALLSRMTRVTYAETIANDMLESTLRWSADLKYAERYVPPSDLIVKV